MHSADRSAQQYVIRRARALGHTDLLPTSWTTMYSLATEYTLDEQLEHLAMTHDVSVVQLKTVYLRGVDDFLTSDITYGSATMYGLARAQRFIQERGSAIDADLVAVDQQCGIDSGIEISVNSFFPVDLVYSSGEKIAALFAPGVVTGLTLSDNELLVIGELGSFRWSYQLDIHSGEQLFDVQ